MNLWEQAYRTALFVALPFVIAAAFRYTDWMGWPAALVFGWIWVGNIGIICKKAG